MIIWGSRGREIEQASGQFYCPQCESEQRYRHLRLATYFTLYFIPLFETAHHGDYIKCGQCNGQFSQQYWITSRHPKPGVCCTPSGPIWKTARLCRWPAPSS